jgi:hypothetical protein
MTEHEMGNHESEVATRLAGLRPPPRPSRDLSLRLRALASQEARRQRLRSNPMLLAREVQQQAQLWMDNLARPLAVPIAGGVMSAVLLFLSIAPAFPIRRPIVDDVPVRITTPAALEFAFLLPTPAAPPMEDVVLDIAVDSAGRVVDYSVAEGNEWTDNPEARKSLESALVCTRFNPATLFGQPQPGTIRLTIRRSELEVRGQPRA